MHARERIVRERFAEQTCAHCGAQYPPEGVVVLARRRSTWMVMATCTQCQQPGLFVVSFPDAQRGVEHEQPSEALPAAQIEIPNIIPNLFLPTSPDTLSRALADTPPPELPDLIQQGEKPSPVTVNDVNKMHEFLARFNGDFNTLFAHIRPQPSDDSST